MAKIGDAIAATLGDVSRIDTAPVQMVPLDDLHPNPANFYPPLDSDALYELSVSIEANGLLEPLTVTPCKDGYRIISGHNRWMALKSIRGRYTRPDLTKAVPCVVLPEMSAARELTLVIEANRQRVKGAALLAAEAEKLTEAYRMRKEAGEKLPGRIRDRVAESLRVSASKLAQAEATKKNLTLPGFAAQWESGKIGDTVAYEISKMEGDHQYRLLDWLCDNGREAGSLTVKDVRALEEQFNTRERKWDMPREKEDKMFLKAADRLLTNYLRADFSCCQTRAEAIAELKKATRTVIWSGRDHYIYCSSWGVKVRNGRRGEAPELRRSWAEVYDAMCLVALRKEMEGRK